MTKPSIVFFGTGPVSYATLVGIAESFNIEAIITKPVAVSPHGRPLPHPVLDWAKDHDVPALTPSNKAELNEAVSNQNFSSRAGLVVDYGIIIPQSVIDAFELGIVNSHFSLLPELRGADPITGAILSGQATTGVSLMTIVQALDEGPLLAQETLDIKPDTTTPELTDQLVSLSNKIIQDVVPSYIYGSVKPYSQSTEITPTYTRKLQKSDGIIDWSKPAAQIEREIHAYKGWPASRTTLHDRDVIVTAAHIGEPSDHELSHSAGDGQPVIIDRLKPAGKGEMSGSDFLRGLPKK